MTRALALALLVLPAAAQAQDEERRTAREADAEVIREIERGLYLKADIGSTIYLGTHGYVRPTTGQGLLSGVMVVNLTLGSDFIDKERFSAAWEVGFGQGLFNGPRFEDLVGLPPFIQGDIHTFSATGGAEVSTYLSRRFGLGIRAGGGVMMIPLLMAAAEYNASVVPIWGTPASVHVGPKPLVYGGPTIEYYTKLSHFSVGVDVDVAFVIGLDLGVSPLGYFKYTF